MSGLGAKRLMDLALGSALLVAVIPLCAVIAAVIRVTSPGPALYRGTRVGQGGRPFAMFKLRTMRVDADRVGPGITAGDDPRITGVGRILRRTKLDELPQLLNVVRGDMSLVGPRPEAPEYVARYDLRQRQVLSLRPGITGPTQLVYRHEEAMLRRQNAEEWYRRELLPRKLESDLDYLRTRSLQGDASLLLATVLRLFSAGSPKPVRS